MNPYLAGTVILLATLLQTSALPVLLPGRMAPNLVLALVVSWGLLSNRRESALLAVSGGLALDLLSGGPLGGNVASLLAVSYLATAPAFAGFRGSLWLPGVAAVACTALNEVIYASALALLGRSGVVVSVLWVFLPLLVLNSVSVYALFYFLTPVYDRSRVDRLATRQ